MRRAVGFPLVIGLIVTAVAYGVAVAEDDVERFDEPSTWETIQLAAGYLSSAFVIGVVVLPFTRTRKDGS